MKPRAPEPPEEINGWKFAGLKNNIFAFCEVCRIRENGMFFKVESDHGMALTRIRCERCVKT